jgi:DNA repair protein RadA/Sms
MGFCPQCRASGTMGEGPGAVGPVPITRLDAAPEARITTGVAELDRVLGGGIVEGSVTLVAGEPGVGKSTLVLGAAAALGRRTLVVSGEESVGQLRMRAARIGALVESVSVAVADDAEDIVAMITEGDYDLAIIDSIQTVGVPDTAAGSSARVRQAASRLVTGAKASGTAVMMTGHVTKEGGIAGPKLLEHIVDVVITMEGDPHRGLRFLRCVKNRYGSVEEVGVFEMSAEGLTPVPDPSATLIAGRDPAAPGSVLFPTVDGLRSLMVEIQSLVVPSSHPQPRRSVKGLPPARVHQVLAALERHAGLSLARFEIYVSAMGGLSITEPAADLAVALAVASAASGVAISDVAAWGEVGLTGELRAVPHSGRRRAEVERFGLGGVIEGSAYGHLLDALVDSGLAAVTVNEARAADTDGH